MKNMDRRMFLCSSTAAIVACAGSVASGQSEPTVIGYVADRNGLIGYADVHWSNGSATRYYGALSVLKEAVLAGANNSQLISICLDAKHSQPHNQK